MYTTSESMIGRLQTGAEQDTDAFLQAYYPYFKVRLLKAGCPPSDVDDLCTTVALKLLAALPGFDRRRPGSLRALIRVIVKRSLANHYRHISSKRVNSVTGALPLDEGLTGTEDEGMDFSAMDMDLLHGLCAEAISRCLARVEPVTYRALKMYLLEYRDAAEVSDTLGLSPNSVYNHKRNFLLNVVDEAQSLSRQRQAGLTRAELARALYHYLLDNNPALTVADAELPPGLRERVDFVSQTLAAHPAPVSDALLLLGPDSRWITWSALPFSIGARKADLIIPDERLSGPHCRLRLDNDGLLVLQDLGSANGLWVNGERLSERHLLHGDLIQLGRAATFIYAEAAADYRTEGQ